MTSKLFKWFQSLRTSKRVDDNHVTVTVDDTREGKKLSLDNDTVDRLLRKAGLLETADEDPSISNEQFRESSKNGN